ncbi:MAG: hypothetical protein LIO86_09730 [Lachnospiraceae bacterium]|nr:hypothetical protein [Lachnospiraceae bacterium]
MRVTAKIEASVLQKETRIVESTGKPSYTLAIMQGTQAGSISCTEAAYNLVKPFCSYVLTGVYDDKYQYMRITDVDIKTEKSIVPAHS